MKPPRVLLIGGYGGFGARLARRLASDGWQVIVGGRKGAKARDFAASLPNGDGVALDRNGDISAVLSELDPLLVIDAAGPFQGSGYGVVEACLARGVHYLDLADARDFVCGIERYDAAAQAAGIAVISGASSVPALSGAVLRELTQGLERVDRVDLAISASDRATAGTSVATAILGYAGQPIRLWDGRGWLEATGWHGVRRERYYVPGMASLSRWVALVDVPDHALIPASLAGSPATTFRAGPEFGFQLGGIWAISWLVKWGAVRSLAPLAPHLRLLQRMTAFLCSDRSAMSVTVLSGDVKRRWTLIADNGDGPEVPTLAAQLLARRIAAGTLRTGARQAGAELDLADFVPLFGELAIATGTDA